MKKFDFAKIMMFLILFLGILELTVGKYILAGVFFIIAYSVYRNGGGGKYNDRSLYEKEVKVPNVTIQDIYEAFKDMDTPLGRCWIGKYKNLPDDVVVFGPTGFKDCIVIGKNKDKVDLRCIVNMSNVHYPEEEKWRFDNIIDTEGMEVTPQRYSIFAGAKLMTTVLLSDLTDLVVKLNEGNAVIPKQLDMFELYHTNSTDNIIFDADNNFVLQADSEREPLLVRMSDCDGNEMAKIIEVENEKDRYEILADGEHYGYITKEKGKNDIYTIDTSDGTFTATNFHAVSWAKMSSNYEIKLGDEIKAYTGCSAKVIFEGIGTTNNAVICSFDDDYIVLYAAFQMFILNVYKWMR